MIARNSFAMAAFVCALAACAATPEVAVTDIRQDSLTRLVTVQYTLSNPPAIVTADFLTNGVSIGAANFANVSGAVNRRIDTAGTHEITWQPVESWSNHVVAVSGGGFSAKVTAWRLNRPPDYMVVDLSTPSNVWWYVSADALPGGLTNNVVYSTTNLVMRRISAVGIPWQQGSLRDPCQSFSSSVGQTVILDEDFYIGVFEVTQGQFNLFASNRQGSFYGGADHWRRPMENCSYNEVYCQPVGTHTKPTEDTYMYPNPPKPNSWLGKARARTGIMFDLPSESQWEYACRSGLSDGRWNDGTAYSSADAANNCSPGRFANNGGLYADDNWSKPTNVPPGTVSSAHGTAVVGSYAPSLWGLYDMHGNVCEMCHDYAGTAITKHPGKVNANGFLNLDGIERTNRMRRGGCWYWTPSSHAYSGCRSDELDPTACAKYTGFRVICPAYVNP